MEALAKHINLIRRLSILSAINLLVLLPNIVSIGKNGLHLDKLVLFLVLTMTSIAIISKIIHLLIGISIVLINIIYLHIDYRWGFRWLGARIETALESPHHEILSYFDSFFGLPEIFILIYSILTLILLFHSFKNKNIYKTDMWFSFIWIALTLLVFSVKNERILNLEPVKIVKGFYSAKDRISKYKARESYLGEYIYANKNCSGEYEKVVIVIGESATKHRMSSYGFERATTPFVDSSDPFLLNAISPANLTRYSLPIMLTNATASNFDLFFTSISVVSRLRECGYETFWLSGPPEIGSHETYIGSIANEADNAYYLNKNFQVPEYDEGLVDLMGSIDIAKKKKQAFFIHLYGSHFTYSDRYPSSSKFFVGDSIESSYDNSIYYTDKILSMIYSKFDKNNLLLIYVSDHGEVVDNNFHGHGFSPPYKEEYDIPFVVWSMENQKIQKIINKGNPPINTESFNYIVEYLVGLRDDPDISYSLDVLSVGEGNLVDYSKLNSFNK